MSNIDIVDIVDLGFQIEGLTSSSILIWHLMKVGNPDVPSWMKVTWRCQVWWSILWIIALHFTHPKCTHTAVNTQTPWTHTRSSGKPFMLRRPGSSCGFGALLKLLYWGWRERWTFTPPTYYSCRILRVRLSNHSAMTSRFMECSINSYLRSIIFFNFLILKHTCYTIPLE